MDYYLRIVVYYDRIPPTYIGKVQVLLPVVNGV